MKRYKKFISFIMVFLLLFSPIKVYATSGSFDGFTKDGIYDAGNGTTYVAYTYPNDNALPSSGFFYFYNNNGVVRYYTYNDVLTDIITRKIGIIMEPTRLASFLSDLSVALRADPNYYNTMTPIVDSNGRLVGVALNGLTGGKIYSDNSVSAPNTNVEVPSWEVNRVYNYYEEWITLPEHALLPDWITIKGETNGYFANRCDANNQYYQKWHDAMNTGHKFYSVSSSGCLYLSKNTEFLKMNQTWIPFMDNDCVFVAQSDAEYKSTIDQLGLSLDNNTTTYSRATSGYAYAKVSLKNKTTYEAVYDSQYSRDGTITDNAASNRQINFSNGDQSGVLTFDLTIWRNTNALVQIQNNTYEAPQYFTNDFRNFSTSNNNSYTTTSNSINNSSSSNSSIYNSVNTETSNNYNEQVTNNTNTTTTIDNSSSYITNTNIVNNYYNTYYPPENNDDNNNGGGSGGSGDVSGGNGDNIDDDGFLDTLLAAILKLLRAIGKIIATILTGIVDILTDLLLAITNITTGFDGIIQFIGSIIGFMPAEVVTIITVGLGLSVLIALLKMFGK